MIKLYCESCLDTINRLPDDSVQLAFLDPPYNINASKELKRPEGGSYRGMANYEWDSFQSYQHFTEFFESVIHALLMSKMAPTGTFMVCGTYHNLLDVGNVMRRQGAWVLNKIIWQKPNPVPHFLGVRLQSSYEEIVWYSQGPADKYKFNYQEMKKYNDGKQLRDIWTIPTCAGKERVKDPITGKTAHPSQKPIRLLTRLIEMATDRGDLVFDPFAGMGTTLVAAKALGRRGIASEIDTAYAYLAQERINVFESVSTISA